MNQRIHTPTRRVQPAPLPQKWDSAAQVDPRVEAPKCDYQIPDNKFWGIHNRVFVL